MSAASKASKRSWVALYRRRCARDRPSCCGPVDFRFRRLLRSGQGAVRSSGHDGLGRRPAQNAPRVGTPSQRGPGRPPAAPHATPGVAMAIDLHLDPYYGQPHRSRNEIYYGQPKQGTTKFHAYASACIVEYGRRYTLALTWVRRHESTGHGAAAIADPNTRNRPENKVFAAGSGVFQRGGDEIPAAGKPAVLDAREVRGATPKKGRKLTGLRAIQREPAGWYSHTMKSGKRQ